MTRGHRAGPPGLRAEILHRDESMCQMCGRRPRADGVILHVDHITPYSRGGPTEPGNLRTLCHLRNLGKGNRFTG